MPRACAVKDFAVATAGKLAVPWKDYGLMLHLRACRLVKLHRSQPALRLVHRNGAPCGNLRAPPPLQAIVCLLLTQSLQQIAAQEQREKARETKLGEILS